MNEVSKGGGKRSSSECLDVVILDGAMSSKQLDLKYHLDLKKYNKKGRGNLPKCQFIRS